MIVQPWQKHRGFSLVELMVAIALLGLIATVAVPNFQAWARNYQLKSASNALCSHMQMAKLGAVKENVPWTINFNQNGIRGYNVKNGSGTIVKIVNFSSKYNQEIQYKSPNSSVEYDSPTLTFNPNGTSSVGFAYISNKKTSGYYRVGLSFPNGSITEQKWNGSQWK